MGLYRHVLAAIDLDDHGDRVIQRARELAQLFGARLSLLHVVEYIAIDTGEALLATPPDLSEQLLTQARARLDALCQRCGIPPETAQVASGSVTAEIMDTARKNGVDLIVVGHHPRHGIRAWFTHTEQDVVQRAPCDVLALNVEAAAR